MRNAAILLACAILLSGCISTSPEAVSANDPFEPANRAVYRFDERFDKYVVLPVAWFYTYRMPVPIRRGLHNVMINLNLPVTFANDILQGELTQAGTSLGRFALNSTFGLGGLVDLGARAGLPYRPADFGQTLGRYGVPEGPFLVLPFIGPDPPRDLLGGAVDLSMNPLTYLPPGAPLAERLSVSASVQMGSPFEFNTRNIVLRRELERGSVDPYVTMRSVYRQIREEQISHSPPPADRYGWK